MINEVEHVFMDLLTINVINVVSSGQCLFINFTHFSILRKYLWVYVTQTDDNAWEAKSQGTEKMPPRAAVLQGHFANSLAVTVFPLWNSAIRIEFIVNCYLMWLFSWLQNPCVLVVKETHKACGHVHLRENLLYAQLYPTCRQEWDPVIWGFCLHISSPNLMDSFSRVRPVLYSSVCSQPRAQCYPWGMCYVHHWMHHEQGA